MNLKRLGWLSGLNVLVMLCILSLPVSTFGEEISAAGCWSGEWKSCDTGHRGPMKAKLVECGEGKYRADFKGRFFKIIPFRYSVTLDVVGKDDETITLGGSSDLGRVFGVFQYSATVTDASFHAEYESKRYTGTFSMSR